MLSLKAIVKGWYQKKLFNDCVNNNFFSSRKWDYLGQSKKQFRKKFIVKKSLNSKKNSEFFTFQGLTNP